MQYEQTEASRGVGALTQSASRPSRSAATVPLQQEMPPSTLPLEELAQLPPNMRDMVMRLDQYRIRGQGDLGDRTFEIAIENYHSRERWEEEQKYLFGSLPVVAAHSSELPRGSSIAFDGLGVPIVVTRASDGKARAFLNVCRHRGMTLLPCEKPNLACKGQTLVCPYHAWTYDLKGALKYRLHAEVFDGFEDRNLNLVELPCDEAAGLVFVKKQPGESFSAAEYLQGLDVDLNWLGMPDLQLFRKADYTRDANWKLVGDAFLEAYHLLALHKETIAPFFSDCMSSYSFFGPHSELIVGRTTVQEPFETPTTSLALRKLTTPSQMMFPNTFTVWHPDYLSLVSIYSPEPDKTRWVHSMLIPKEKSGPDWSPHWEKTFTLIEETVFQKEDLYCAEQTQMGIRSGANKTLLVGRYEYPMGRFHQAIDEAIARGK